MRSPRMATIDRGGLDMICDLILSNLDSLQTILKWNLKNGITFFRMGSELFPWMVKYDIMSLPKIDDIHFKCLEIGDFCKKHDIRLTFHPGPFNVLCSPNPDVVERAIQELNDHSTIFDLMGFAPSFNNKINIHVGGAYGDKAAALENWTRNYYRLNESTRCRLTIENDDKPGMYSVQDLLNLHVMCNRELPITFDYFHHRFVPGNLSEQEALEVALSTWPAGVVPATHYSESRREEAQGFIHTILENNRIPFDDLRSCPTLYQYYTEATQIKYQAHSDFISGPVNCYGHTIDVMFEAKYKEKALQSYLDPSVRVKLLTDQVSVPEEQNY
jgi:UV DNA damage endonuclease